MNYVGVFRLLSSKYDEMLASRANETSYALSRSPGLDQTHSRLWFPLFCFNEALIHV
jgi:hypothetical protein